MESSLRSVLVLALAIIGFGYVNSAPVDDGDVSKRSDQTDGPYEQRLRNLEREVQRVKSHLSEVENLLDAWFLSAEQQPSMIVNGADARWIAALDGGNGVEKRAGGGWAFMGSRGKRKQPFILGSRGKRAVNYEPLVEEASDLEPIENDKNDNMDKRAAYFYGSRGKKQFVTGSIDDTEYRMPPYTNKRYTFMGSRG